MSDADRTTAAARPDYPDALDRFGFVTESIRADLDKFVALLREWQRAHNLVSRSALDELWTRHVADSLQLIPHAPKFREWLDLGSGAGFPGLVVAIASKADACRRFTLVESNLKKAAFLRAAIRTTGVNAVVAAERAEKHGCQMAGQADVVSARALAPMGVLLGLAAPYLHADSLILLLKGQDFVHEHEAASKSWSYDMLAFPSATDQGGRILAIRNLRTRGHP